jgi:hypothetical protein
MLNEKECAIEEKEREIMKLKDENEKMKKFLLSSSSSPIPSLSVSPSNTTKIEGNKIKIKSFREECLTQKENKIEWSIGSDDNYANFNIDPSISSVSSLFHSLSLILLFLMRESGNCFISPSSLFHSSF